MKTLIIACAALFALALPATATETPFNTARPGYYRIDVSSPASVIAAWNRIVLPFSGKAALSLQETADAYFDGDLDRLTAAIGSGACDSFRAEYSYVRWIGMLIDLRTGTPSARFCAMNWTDNDARKLILPTVQRAFDAPRARYIGHDGFVYIFELNPTI